MSLASHDRSLKYLLAQQPADFIRFGLQPASVQVLRPVEIDLPVRDRVVDGSYLIKSDGQREVAHVEFYRRHQELTELALDVGDAQIRIYRRERVPVTTMLWDLYGSPNALLLSNRVHWLGRPEAAGSSLLVYRRVNLRAMAASELITQSFAALYPLVSLTRDGADAEVVRHAASLIEQRTELEPAQRADHLAVLRFLAEAESVPVKVLQLFLSREKMMESSLYREIFQEGKAEGEAKVKAELLIRLLAARLGRVAPEVRQAIQAQTDPDRLSVWFDEAALADSAEAAQQMIRKITAV